MQIQYLIRLDDACPTMDWTRWNLIFAILDEFKIKPMVGVVPNNKDEGLIKQKPNTQFWDVVRVWESKGYAIAMHGNTHVYHDIEVSKSMNQVNDFSEFVGLSLDKQKLIIREGWNVFMNEGIVPKYFFAPGNTYDLNTIRAICEETSIRLLSDSIAFKPYRFNKVIFIPQQSSTFRKFYLPGTWTLSLHPNTMTDENIDSFYNFIKANKKNIISFDDLSFGNIKKKSLYDKLLYKLVVVIRKLRR